MSAATHSDTHWGSEHLSQNASQHLHENKANANMMSRLERKDLKPKSERKSCLFMHAVVIHTSLSLFLQVTKKTRNPFSQTSS